MKIVWDEPKRIANLDKHHLDFEDVVFFRWETAHIAPTHSNRMKAIGEFGGLVTVIVYAELGVEAISIISFRVAKREERSLFDGR